MCVKISQLSSEGFELVDSYRFCTLFQELSDEKHYEGDEHNTDYDHEAFLGKEESKTFDQLTPEESKERLG